MVNAGAAPKRLPAFSNSPVMLPLITQISFKVVLELLAAQGRIGSGPRF